MIADTLVVVLVCLSPAQPLQTDSAASVSHNRFSSLFSEADKEFERKYHLTEKLRQAVKEAAAEADRQTAHERNRILDSTRFLDIITELKKNLPYEYP